jgi:hypothetical protein
MRETQVFQDAIDRIVRHGERKLLVEPHDQPVAKEQCCSACHATKILPAREAERAAEEARYRAYAEAYQAKKEAERSGETASDHTSITSLRRGKRWVRK